MSKDAVRYWLAVVSDANCAILASMDRPYYAASRLSRYLIQRVNPGDLCVLYRSKVATGFVGTYEITEPVKHLPTKVGAKTFANRISWKSRMINEEQPVNIKPLLNELGFIHDKKHYSAYLQTSLREISKEDFLIIDNAIRVRVSLKGAEPHVANRGVSRV